MLSFTHDQLVRIEREYFSERVGRFIQQRCLRDDFRRWTRGRAEVAELWAALWPAARQHSEHDLALAMVLLAVGAHSDVPLGKPLLMLQGIGQNEVPVKSFLAERGYFDFTAFDRDATTRMPTDV